MADGSPGISTWIWFLWAITILNVAIWLRTAGLSSEPVAFARGDGSGRRVLDG